MDVRKLRGSFFRVCYSFIRLIAAVEDFLAAYQKVDLFSRLNDAGCPTVSFLQQCPEIVVWTLVRTCIFAAVRVP